MTELIKDLILRYKNLDKLASDLKPVFEQWITNLEVPLSTRWGLWVAAPVSLKNKKPWIQHLSFGKVEISWFDSPVYADRRMEVVLDEVVSSIENNEDEEEFWFAEGLTKEQFDYYLNQLKEDILEKNLYSFENDW